MTLDHGRASVLGARSHSRRVPARSPRTTACRRIHPVAYRSVREKALVDPLSDFPARFFQGTLGMVRMWVWRAGAIHGDRASAEAKPTAAVRTLW